MASSWSWTSAWRVIKRIHLVGGEIFAKFGVDLIKLGKGVDDILHAFFDNLAHRLAVVKLRLLLQKANGIAVGQHRLAVKIRFYPCHNAQQGAFAGAIETQDTDLGAIIIGNADVAQDLILRWVSLAHLHHRVNDFVVDRLFFSHRVPSFYDQFECNYRSIQFQFKSNSAVQYTT